MLSDSLAEYYNPENGALVALYSYLNNMQPF
jgi:hypothetical protein